MFGVDFVAGRAVNEDKKDKIRGLKFTHEHDDHIGGIAHLYGKFENFHMWGTVLNRRHLQTLNFGSGKSKPK